MDTEVDQQKRQPDVRTIAAKKRLFLMIFFGYQVLAVLAFALLVWWCAAVVGAMHETEDELRERLTSGAGLHQLEAWADEVLAGYEPDGQPHYESVFREFDELGGLNGTLVDGGKRSTPYYDIEFGGGFRHYGLLIGPSGFTPESSDWERTNQWTDTVWYREDTQ